MARTKDQNEVAALFPFLPSMKPSEELEAMRAYPEVYVGKGWAWCTCCGEVWESDIWDNRRLRKAECPHCHVRGAVKRSPGKRIYSSKWYFSLVRVVEGWQVVRNFFCESLVRKGDRPAWHSCKEVSQVWMKPGHKPVFVGRSVNGCCQYKDVWKMSSPLTLKYDHYRYRLTGEWSRDVELLPIVKRNGLKSLRRKAGLVDQLEAIMDDPRAEILAKGRQWNLFEFYCSSPWALRSRWDSVRVAMRHKYKVTDAGLWLDYIDELGRQGKDLRNPKFICPANLRKAHDEAMRIKKRLRKKREMEMRLREMEQAAKNSETLTSEYRARLADLLDVEVKSGRIVLRPLQTVYDFFLEGDALHHCVYTCGYYKKKGCLVIGATVGGKRTETIEFDIRTGKVLQCRGRFNKPSSYHSAILSLVEANKHKFIRQIS